MVVYNKERLATNENPWRLLTLLLACSEKYLLSSSDEYYMIDDLSKDSKDTVKPVSHL